MAQFKRGDRVKLTEKAANTAMRGYCQLARKIPTDWRQRRGVVEHTTNSGSACVLITWDDKKWPDSWPKGAIELINDS